MGRRPKGDPVLSLSASADSTTPGQTAKLHPPRPAPVNLEDVPEFQDELRRQRQASQAQLVLQVVMVTTLIVRWFRGRNKPKPKPRGRPLLTTEATGDRIDRQTPRRRLGTLPGNRRGHAP